MKKILLSSMLLVLSLSLWAVTATPYPFEVILPNGQTMTVRLVGDEYHAYYTTLDGTPLRCMDNGYFVEDHTVKEEFPQIASVRRSAAIRSRANATTFPLQGSPKSLVLLVGFKDLPFAQKNEDFNALLNESGYAYNNATGSCRDYFIAASDSIFQPQFDVYGPFTLSENMEYYGKEEGDSHDRNPYQMIIEACQLAADSGVDFDEYDTDNDGVLDNVFVYYAGHNQAEGASSNTIWPHQSNVSWKDVRVDGKLLAAYACTSEYSGNGGTRRASIGTFCHEFGHVLGLPDLYDTDYKYYTVSNWSIMCSGNYNNNGRTPPTYSAYERFYLGWLKPQQLLEKGQYFLQPLQTYNSAYLIADGIHNLLGSSPSPKEFFLLEYRTKTGWDAYLPGQGMLVWHIDYSAAAWAENTPNNGPNFLRIHMEEANGITWKERNNSESGKASDPYPGTQNVRTFIPKLHDGTILSGQNIFDIADDGNMISFIYQSIGNVKMSVDKSELNLTTTVSDTKKIEDWEPQSLNLSVQELTSDTIVFTTKGSFYVYVGDAYPKRTSSEWKRTLEYEVTEEGISVHTIWVSYIPNKQSCDEVTGSLNISTLGATVPVTLTGRAPRPTYITTPDIQPASKITPYSFQLAWKPIDDAVLYYVTLYQAGEGEATFTQGFEQFNSFDAIKEQGWESNINRTTTSAKADGSKALYLKNTGEYITTEEYMAPLQSISFWVNAFSSDAATTGYINVEAWNGAEWMALPEYRVEILSSMKKKTLTVNFGEDTQYTRVRLTYTDNGGSGIALDAFEATCARNLIYIYRGKELSIDATLTDIDLFTYEITGLSAGATYYCAVQSSDITKGCEEHISPLSEPIEIKTIEVQEGKEGENQLPIAIDEETKTPIIYLSNPTLGSVLNVYNVSGVLVYSLPVYNAVTEYAIPIDKLQLGNLYLVKYIEAGKMKRKQAWAKFVF